MVSPLKNLKKILSPIHPSSEELAPYRISFKISDHPVDSARKYLKEVRENLRQLHDSHMPEEMIVRLNTLYIDDLILTLFERADWLFQESHPDHSTRCTLMALGGYGRSELNLCSDIDLLFIYPKKPDDYLNAINDAILYPLWDIGLDVGYATRSLNDCQAVLNEDMVSFTSMLDARYLAGDKTLASQFFKIIDEQISLKKNIQRFIEAKNLENEERLKRFGSSVYILEPNVKESEGGLRDFHMLAWFVKVLAHDSNLKKLVELKILTEDSLQELIEARNFIWRIRNALHFKTFKKTDQLTFQYQQEIAKEMGYEDSNQSLAVEKFMQTYYHHAANIKRITHLAKESLIDPSEKKFQKILERISIHYDDDFAKADDKIIVKNENCFEKSPVNLIRVFLVSQRENLEIHEETKRLMVHTISKLDESFARDPEVNLALRELLVELKGLGRVLNLMHELRLLDRLIPEFGEVLYQVQHDVYHIYTVDTHSIFAVNELTKLKEGSYDQEFPLYKEVLHQVSRHDLLALGVFFHDVGKGRGKNHSVVGAEMSLKATERMGYPEKDREIVEFLVKSHLLMPHLAQRRDLDDANLIIQFAKSMQHVELLNMLFILTWADIRAVGPDVWTPWKGTLLSELYVRTKKVLETGSFSPERANLLAEQAKQKVIALVKDKGLSNQQKEYLNQMPVKYFLAHSPEEILRHLDLASKIGSETILIESSLLEKDNVNELLLYTLATPALLAKVTGVMAANDLNILEVKQYISKTGAAFLILRFTDSQGEIFNEERRIDLLKSDLTQVLEGKTPISQLIEKRRKPTWFKKKIAQTVPSMVEVDNDVSAYYTVIDIYTHDRIGLLYEIFTAISNLGLYVDVSKISTKVDQVADVFYVKDIFGQKITSSDKIKKIRSELMQVIEK